MSPPRKNSNPHIPPFSSLDFDGNMYSYGIGSPFVFPPMGQSLVPEDEPSADAKKKENQNKEQTKKKKSKATSNGDDNDKDEAKNDTTTTANSQAGDSDDDEANAQKQVQNDNDDASKMKKKVTKDMKNKQDAPSTEEAATSRDAPLPKVEYNLWKDKGAVGKLHNPVSRARSL
ncbi:hypothetical protein F4778DRAFT_783684 [Xylariomycetidae sp. FL2044]|nr:hypothetical protein F4778DRAFT_783684 [Xylariomycetidae sp. FL2044]